LAVFSLRGGLEPGSSNDSAGSAALAAMTPGQATARRTQTIRELLELIAALDRRVPHVERVGELSIGRAASALKLEALKRIQELEGEPPPTGPGSSGDRRAI